MSEVNEVKGNVVTEEIQKTIENDLRCYPDWIISIETGGLGAPSKSVSCGNQSMGSYIESQYEVSEAVKRKVSIIEYVLDNIHGETKKVIEERYFRGYEVKEVMESVGIGSTKYYNCINKAIEKFARAFGYIV